MSSERSTGRGAADAAPRPTPLTIVSGPAVGNDLERVARVASEALGAPVAVAWATEETVSWPANGEDMEDLRSLAGAAGETVTNLYRERNLALREAELLCEVAGVEGNVVAGQEATYRLLIGLLLRDRDELELLRSQTIAPLIDYDAEHDSELVATLETFLARHGSTSETAEAMGLHRHTVGYRLSRAHEVSGLSPHESDGRERLGLGLKAHLILEADHRLSRFKAQS